MLYAFTPIVYVIRGRDGGEMVSPILFWDLLAIVKVFLYIFF